jgi:hypothetical protein
MFSPEFNGVPDPPFGVRAHAQPETVSSVAMATTSSALSSKSKIWKFSIILSSLTDFGITTTPLCVSQRRMTCATLLLYLVQLKTL